MIPIGDTEKINRKPWVNTTLIILNICIFIYLYFYAKNPEGLIKTLGFIPAAFFKTGWNPIDYWEKYIPLITSQFIHGSWMHVLGNMLFLFVFGDNIEDKIGHFRYFLFYLFCGIVAIMGHSYSNVHSTIVLVGASGAIAGVMGAFYILFPRAKVKSSFIFFSQEIPAIYYLFVWFILNLARGLFFHSGKFAEPVAWWAHISGFIAGALIINFFIVGAPQVKARVKIKTGQKVDK
jgi:membrane associated rhomboid family serine protease